MAPARHARNATLCSLLAAGILTGGFAMPAIAQDTTPTPAPTITTNTNTTTPDGKAATVKAVTLKAGTPGHSFSVSYTVNGSSTGIAWTNGTWVGRFDQSVITGENDATMTATITYDDGTESNPVQLTASDFNANAAPALGTTKANSRRFTGNVDGMPLSITYTTYDAEPIGFWNLLGGTYPTRGGDGTYRYDYQDTTYDLSKDTDGDGWHGSLEKVIFYSPDREGFNGGWETLPSLPVVWGEPQKVTENGRQLLKADGTAKGEIAGQPVEITVHAATEDPDADDNPTWTYTDLHGVKQQLLYQNGELTSSFNADYDAMPKSITVTSDTGETVALTRDDREAVTTDGDQLGVSTIKGSVMYTADATGTHPAFRIYGAIKDGSVTGKPVTVKDGPAFTKNDDGTFTATDSNYTLDGRNRPSSDTVTLSNGQSAPIIWDKTVQTVEKDIDGTTTKFIRLNGTATGSVGSQKFTITTTADRAYDTHVTLSVTQTPAEGDPTRIEVPDATGVNAADLKDTYTLATLPHDRVGDQYTLNVDTANQMDVNVGDTTATIGDNGERRLTTTVTYTDDAGAQQTRTVTVTVPFDKAKPTVGNPDAALDGFLVNGSPMEGFDPDQLDYTITAKADEKVTVKPIAREGQTVTASDIRQTAWTTVQEWAVEKNGQTRTYTVTLVREHSPEQATADDKFTPADPIAQPSTVEPDSPADTQLADHGYVVDGKYHAVSEDDYTIPEGGVFSYGAKIGQAVKVGVEKTGGMTYTYKVGVLAADQKTYGEHTYKVTYLTAATHKAELTGINVDGAPIAGFDPATHEYTVEVKNPDKWTVTPQFDKSTGMSVSTHKDGDKAVITVSSADNLNTVTYTVTVTQKMKLLDKLGLADTGTTALMAIIGAVVLIATGAAAGFFSLRRRKPKTDATGNGTDAATTAADADMKDSDSGTDTDDDQPRKDDTD